MRNTSTTTTTLGASSGEGTLHPKSKLLDFAEFKKLHTLKLESSGVSTAVPASNLNLIIDDDHHLATHQDEDEGDHNETHGLSQAAQHAASTTVYL